MSQVGLVAIVIVGMLSITTIPFLVIYLNDNYKITIKGEENE